MGRSSTSDASRVAAAPSGRLTGRERRNLIAAEIARHGHASCAGLARRLGVSEMTIRRDLDTLERTGVVKRAHGGAVAAHSAEFDLVEPDVDDRSRINAAEKRRIGQFAARLCRAEQFIALDIGTTTLSLAHALMGRNVRFFTSSLRIAAVLGAAGETVMTPGGAVAGSEPSLVGALTRRQIEAFRFDIVFLGISGVSPPGLYDYSLEDSEIKRALIEQAGRVVALADHSKFDRISVSKVCDLASVDEIVTDAAPAGALAAALRSANVTVSVAAT